MPSAPEIAICYLDPPKNYARAGEPISAINTQADCVASVDCTAGFKVLSVNVRDEIAVLAERYPQVEFVATDRSAGAIAGRPTPLIDDLLLALDRQPQAVVGIVNADLCMETGKDWIAPVTASVASTVLLGHRLDVASWSTRPGEMAAPGFPYTGGFDLFFFEKSAIPECLAAAGAKRFFSMGMPWWDFWFPITLALQGYRVAMLEEPLAGHLIHPIKYDPAVWEYMGAQFVDYVCQQTADGVALAIPELSMPVIARVPREPRLARAEKELKHWTRARALDDRGDKWSNRYKTNLGSLYCGLDRSQLCGTPSAATASATPPQADPARYHTSETPSCSIRATSSCGKARYCACSLG